jgi:acylphosphatase
MSSENLRSLHLFLSGRVQGVGFRFFTIKQANRYHLTGWVRNLPDGRVEIFAEGPVNGLTMFLDDVSQGPSSARVSNVSEDWQEISARRHDNFSIKY